MNNYEDAILKRIVKAYLLHNGEASTRMIANHIQSSKYGLKYEVNVRVLGRRMRRWALKPSNWFRVEYVEKGKTKWWRLV